MAIRLKTAEQIQQMRQAGQIVRRVLDRIGRVIAPGVRTRELNELAERMTAEAHAQPLFKGVPGHGRAGPFPAAICCSINEELVHGIPSDRAIAEGDVVSVDFGVRLNGWCGDAAETYLVGQVPPEARRLVDVTRTALEMAVRMCRPAGRWSSIARAMQDYVEAQGFSIVRDFVGHGIGSEMWEDPKVPNYVSRDLEANDIVLEPGLVLAIEPMVNAGSPAVEYAPDGWTVRTRDRRPAAHFEHTVAITPRGAEVLTQRA